MPDLESLEVEVLSWIFELVDDTAPATTKSLALVCRQFNLITKTVAHRHKTLDFVAGHHYGRTNELKAWLQNEDILRGLRHLTIESRGATIEESDEADEYDHPDDKWQELVSLIEKLANLKVLVWNHDCMLPLPVLNALHVHQKKAELQIYFFQREIQEADENVPAEVALSRSPALTAIRAGFPANGGHPDLREACFKRIVATAPNLRFASLSRWATGCVIYGVNEQQLQDEEEMEEKFYTHKKPSRSLRRLTLDGFGMSEALLDHWSQFVDLSLLDDIKVSRGAPNADYFKKSAKVLTNLKAVALNLSYLGSDDSAAAFAVEDYLATITPLHKLSLWSWMGKVSLEAILARHGQSLTVLELHERETTVNGEGKRKVLSTDQVGRVREQCPKLRELTIDCDRPSRRLRDAPESIPVLTELKTMNLRRIQIYFDLGIAASANDHAQRYTRSRLQQLHGQAGDSDTDSDEEEGADEAEAADVDENDFGLVPSANSDIEEFVSKVWKFMFGDRAQGILECKVGEWERKL